jgi:hypothetical protein
LGDWASLVGVGANVKANIAIMAPGSVFILPRGNSVAIDHARALLCGLQRLDIETAPEEGSGFGL